MGTKGSKFTAAASQELSERVEKLRNEAWNEILCRHTPRQETRGAGFPLAAVLIKKDISHIFGDDEENNYDYYDYDVWTNTVVIAKTAESKPIMTPRLRLPLPSSVFSAPSKELIPTRRDGGVDRIFIAAQKDYLMEPIHTAFNSAANFILVLSELERLGVVSLENADLTLALNTTKEALMDCVTTFIDRVNPGDSVIVVFIGHSVLVRSSGCFVAVDNSDARQSAVQVGEIADLIQQRSTRRVCFMLDCACRNSEPLPLHLNVVGDEFVLVRGLRRAGDCSDGFPDHQISEETGNDSDSDLVEEVAVELTSRRWSWTNPDDSKTERDGCSARSSEYLEGVPAAEVIPATSFLNFCNNDGNFVSTTLSCLCDNVKRLTPPSDVEKSWDCETNSFRPASSMSLALLELRKKEYCNSLTDAMNFVVQDFYGRQRVLVQATCDSEEG